ncbi:FG-GAP repeat domain-containing protein [Agarivorans sp. MS3-6]
MKTKNNASLTATGYKLISMLITSCFTLSVHSLTFIKVDTNTNSIVEQWHDTELKQQGGKFGSHGWWPWGVGGFDFDNDGDVDLYLSHHGTPGGKILVNQLIPKGQLRFDALSSKTFLPGADDKPWFFDFDGDGWLDIAAFSDEKKVPYLLNKESHFVSGRSDDSFSPVSYPKAVSDLNNDGYLDLDAGVKGAFIYQPSDGQFQRDKSFNSDVSPLLAKPYQQIEKDFKAKNKKNRFFRAQSQQFFINRTPELQVSVNPLDLNNDGLADVVVSGFGGYGGDHLGWYFLANQQQNYSLANEMLHLPQHATPIFIGDLNADGQQDIIAVGKGEGDVFLNNDGKFKAQNSILKKALNAGAPYLVRIFAVDFDNDQDLDIVYSNPRKKYGMVLENNGKGAFTKVLNFKGWDSNPIFIADLNNDLRQDLIVGGPDSKSVQVFLNGSTNKQNTLYLYPRYKSPNPYAVDAVVTVFSGGQLVAQQTARHDGLPIAVSLGKISKADVVISYPNGVEQRYPNLSSNQSYSLMLDGQSYIGFVPANLVAD